MRRVFALVMILSCLTSGLFSRNREQPQQVAKVVAVKAHDRGRIAYWERTVPIYDDYPFYDITLAVGQKRIVVRYESMSGYYPAAWDVGKEITTRQQGRGRMVLFNGAEEVPTDVMNSRSEECVPPSAPPTVVTIGPQVPC